MWENLPAIKAELGLFEQALQSQFGSKRNINSYIEGIALDLIRSGGKRLRPAMTIASAMLGDYDRDKALSAAVSIELLHTATLVHDDIIDNAALRRSSPTVFAKHGVSTAVFTGDFIFVKSILALTSAGLPVEYMKQTASAIEAVCVGEVDQYHSRGSMPGFKTYLSRISRKTGALFAASCAMGAHISKLSEDMVRNAARFGGYFGIAFQIMDDLLDITQEQAKIGKPVGNDLKEGIVTLPVILAAGKDPDMRRLLDSCFRKPQNKREGRYIPKIISRKAVDEAITDSKIILGRYVSKAKCRLDKLPDTPGKYMLREIIDNTFSDYIN